MAGCVPKKYGCEHYLRKCQFLAPCCDKTYSCRICHDEKENHVLDRYSVKLIKCVMCSAIQKVQKRCERCGVTFARYFCEICNLFDEQDKRQFHCNECGICRVGGSDNFFHCPKCDMCFSISLINNHRCIERASRTTCPVCVEDIHSSREEIKVPKCGHLIHNHCCEALKAKGIVLCPICQQVY